MFCDVLKQCVKCKDVKPTYEFHRKHASRDNYASYCAECSRLSSRLRREKYPDEWRRFQEGNPKTKARLKVRSRVNRGNMAKGPCCICGSTENIQAHHDDYTKPLEVVWYCVKHHADFHWRERHGVPQLKRKSDFDSKSDDVNITSEEIVHQKSEMESEE